MVGSIVFAVIQKGSEKLREDVDVIGKFHPVSVFFSQSLLVGWAASNTQCQKVNFLFFTETNGLADTTAPV